MSDNLYSVSGTVQFYRGERNFSFMVEAEDEEQALERASAEAAKRVDIEMDHRQKDIVYVIWKGEPSVEFVREISAAEQLRRAGAPQLF